MTDEPIIRVVDLTIGWDDVVLQKNASFEVAHGDIFAILGVSGCGKSTLMRYLVGLEAPLHGSVAVDGVSGAQLEVGRPPFGVVFQSGALFNSMTIGENVGLPLQTWTDLEPEAVGAIVSAKLCLVGLQGVDDKLPSELSGGMKKRAAIARAMVLEPKLLFLDEPSAGLDPVTSVELDELILVLNRALGLTVVVVTHELPSIFKIVSRCIMLDKQSQGIIAAGSPSDLRDSCTDARVQHFFHRTPTAQ
ncbi:MAG: ATP-binding cassette domain-containing protein [Polyangiaceae bacterium]